MIVYGSGTVTFRRLSRGLAPLHLAAVLALTLAACGREPTTFRQLLQSVEGRPAPEASAAIERYVSSHGGTPLIENQSRLVFLARDKNGLPPRIVGDFNQWASTPAGYDATIGATIRVPGTDWSYLEATAYTNARAEYVLLFTNPGGGAAAAEADPLNPRTIQTFSGPHSEVRMPQWVAQPEVDDTSTVPAGQVIAEPIASRVLNGTRRAWFYVPPGYESSTNWYPVMYVLDGGNYVERMQVPQVLDRLIAAKRIPPLIAVFIEPGDRQEEYSRSAQWRAFMATEVVPLVDKRFRTFPAPEQRLILGSSLAAYGAVDLAVEYPDLFGLCAAIAPPAQAATVITNQAKGRQAIRAVKFFVLGGTYDSGVDGARRLRTALDIGTGAVTYIEVPEGHGPEMFRGHIDDALTTLLPAPQN